MSNSERLSLLQKDLVVRLAWSGRGYMRNGLDLFHRLEKYELWGDVQVILGNLAVGIELLLKAFLASQGLELLLCDLPVELRLFLANPDEMPVGFNLRHYEADMRAGKYKTVELRDCLKAFYAFSPDSRQELSPYLDRMVDARNVALHGFFPAFRRYQVDATVFSALAVASRLKVTMESGGFSPKKEDVAFLEGFKKERIDTVHQAIEAARERARKLSAEESYLDVDGWDVLVVKCPVCNRDALAFGVTDEYAEGGMDEDGEFSGSLSLTFHALELECEHCELKLEGSDELRLAGIELHHDRSSEVEFWMEDKYPDPSDFYG